MSWLASCPLLGHALLAPVNVLADLGALLPGHVIALGLGDVGALLGGHVDTFLLRHLGALLARDVTAHLEDSNQLIVNYFCLKRMGLV